MNQFSHNFTRGYSLKNLKVLKKQLNAIIYSCFSKQQVLVVVKISNETEAASM